MLTVAASAGCQVEADLGIKVRNDTSSQVVVKTVDGTGQLTLAGTLAPGASLWVGQSDCGLNVRLRAFSTDGQQI